MPSVRLVLHALLALASSCGWAEAQSTRNGVRLEVGQLAGQSGFNANTFFNVPPSSVQSHVVAEASCVGRRLLARGRARRGALRSVELRLLVTGNAQEGTFGEGACPGMTLAFELEDGTRLEVQQGTVSLRRVELTGGIVEGTFSGTAVRNGEPVTARGDFHLSFATASAP